MRILLLNQAFFPDVVSSGQHLTDLAQGLVQLGHQVTVVTSASGYDDPGQRFPRHEKWKGVEIIRISATHLGKAARWRRAIDFGSFLLSCSLRVLTLKADVVVAMTSPPLVSVLGAFAARLRRARFVFWVMDLNPDEAVAAGWLKSGSSVERALETLLRFSIHSASRIVVLDRFMKSRVLSRGIQADSVATIPPWSHDDAVRFDPEGRQEFRDRNGLSKQFVVMYAGNHSPCHSLDTLLHAAYELRANKSITFVFSGGGSEVAKVRDFIKAHELSNVRQLSYQPLSMLAATLSAADLHAVVLGDAFVGIVHPCKIYNILSVGAPVLYVGPPDSHIADIASDLPARTVRSHRHGDVDGVVQSILDGFREWRPTQLRTDFATPYSKKTLLPRLVEIVGGQSVPVGAGSLPEVKNEKDCVAPSQI
jgi:glycosyltransferase involved in cell wall biosynthesis